MLEYISVNVYRMVKDIAKLYMSELKSNTIEQSRIATGFIKVLLGLKQSTIEVESSNPPC